MDLNTIITIGASISGIFLGALLQYWFGVIRSRRDHFQNLKTQAYVDFLKSLAEITFAQRSGDETMERDAAALMSESKARMCIYGDAAVVKALANFWREGPSLTPERYNDFVKVVTIMRESGFAKEKIDANDVSQLLVGADLNTEN